MTVLHQALQMTRKEVEAMVHNFLNASAQLLAADKNQIHAQNG